MTNHTDKYIQAEPFLHPRKGREWLCFFLEIFGIAGALPLHIEGLPLHAEGLPLQLEALLLPPLVKTSVFTCFSRKTTSFS